ncbi:MAG: tRNA (adenosine(37)-N6)-threonylcarbamoyltransferase complex dimerization subunit type 1 TsaB [Pseudomonadota bacterium]
MNILAFDTAATSCGCAIAAHGEIVWWRCEPLARGHAERLPAMVAEGLKETGLSSGALDRIAVTTGPGGFTGVRVGLAMARGLALRDDGATPIVAVTTLKVIAAEALAAPDGLLVGLIDARRGEHYVQIFDAGLSPLCEPAAEPLAAIAEMAGDMAAGRRTYFIGSGAGEAARLAAARGVDAEALGDAESPDPRTLARLAADAPTTADPKPVYVRPPDAVPTAMRKPARHE